jgi:hypothetical protein
MVPLPLGRLDPSVRGPLEQLRDCDPRKDPRSAPNQGCERRQSRVQSAMREQPKNMGFAPVAGCRRGVAVRIAGAVAAR